MSDGTDESAADYTMTIDVNAVNDAPTVASALPDRSATVGEEFSYQVPEDAFSDVDGDTLSYAAAQDDDSALPEWLSFDATTRTFTGTAAAEDTGTVTVQVTASDGAGETASTTFALEVTAAANTVPTAAAGTVTTDEDTAYAFDASDFGFADADTDDELASVRVVTLPGSGTLAVSGSAVSADQEVAASDLGGNLTFTPAEDAHGSGYASFTFRVSDGTDESAADYTMTIDVTPVNDAPSAGTVTIDDTAPVVGDELTATAAGIADPDGLPAALLLSWQWYGTLAGGSETEIAGATAATYLVRDADAGAALTAKATYQDSGGFANTLASAPTGAVGRAPVLSVGNASATEGQAMTFTVRLSAASTQAVTVDWAASAESGDTAGSGDFTAANGGLTFTAGQTEKAVTVATTGDPLDEENETFTVRLTNATNATLPDPPTATGTIEDDDGAPVLSVGNASATEGRAVTFRVRLTAESGREVRVDWAASAESGDTAGSGDFTAANGALIFTAGQTEKGVRVATTGDSAAEENETFTLRLSNATNATLGTDPTATGTIDDDDDADAVPPPVAPEVEATAGSYTSLEVRWTAPTGGPAATGYELRYRERLLPVRAHRAAAHRQGSAWTEWPHRGTGTEATITGLKVNTAYEVEVRAVYGEVRSAWVRVPGRVRTGAPEAAGIRSMTVVTGAGADGVWSAGERVEVRVRYSAPVTVRQPAEWHNADGLALAPGPMVVLGFGTGPRPGYGYHVSVALAKYTGGSGTDTLSFGYTVTAADAGSGSVGVLGKVVLRGAEIRTLEGGDTGTDVERTRVLTPEVRLDGSGDHAWTAGERIRVRMLFTREVWVTTTGGTPALGLRFGDAEGLGAAVHEARYAGGSGTDTLTFEYEVTAADGTVRVVGVVADSLGLNGGTIRNARGQDAELDHLSSVWFAWRQVDVERPQVGVSVGAAVREGGVLRFTVALRGRRSCRCWWSTRPRTGRRRRARTTGHGKRCCCSSRGRRRRGWRWRC